MKPPERLPAGDPREWINRARSGLTQAKNEVFPIAEVSRHAAREKSIRHGHPKYATLGGRGDR